MKIFTRRNAITTSQTANNELPAQIKYTVPFTAVVNDALLKAAAEDRTDATSYIQRTVIATLIDGDFLAKEDADRIKLFWELVDRTVDAAQDICRSGGFAPSIALDAIKKCMSDDTKLNTLPLTWSEGYRVYVKDDIYKNGNKEKGLINREIGYRVRAGIGGFVEKGLDNKSKTTKVLGEIIQSYTPIKSFDREAVKQR